MGLRWRKNREDGLERARQSLEHAREQHAEQAGKRQDEQERLVDPMIRWAEENHLVALVWDVVQGNGGHK